MTEKEKILNRTEEIFLLQGFHKITMDEIASSLKMSKKTIYKYFTSKDELVKSTAHYFMQRIQNEIENIVKNKNHSIEKIVAIINTIKNIGLNKLSEKWLDDLRHYQPSLWKEINLFRARMINKNISAIFSQGINEGYIINVPHQIIINIFMSSVQSVVNPDFIMNNNFSISQAINSTIKILINGILTEKGKKVYNKLIKNKMQVQNDFEYE